MILSRLFTVQTGSGGERRVIASKAMAADTLLCRFWGPLIGYDATKALGPNESYALQVSPGSYRLLDPPYRYFNHSCEPNCGLNPALDLVLIKAVKEGEELSWDYSTSMLERDWQMPCRCGKPSCRKRIGDFDKLPEALRKFYIDLNVVQAFILKAILSPGQRRRAS